LFRDRFKEKTIIYRKKSLPTVLRDLGKKRVTSVLIEGGGSILGQALDARLIDKVQIYFGSIFTGGPVIAFAGRGASSTQTAVRLTRLSYAKLGDDVRVIGYPVYKSANAAE
jgi:diaminohydroxyphosphoribosylaminopyrimidine deaminase/5-amino-6-(5-phosphoribosylamino)uracil reductase